MKRMQPEIKGETPKARYYHAGVYIPQNNEILFFGGNTQK